MSAALEQLLAEIAACQVCAPHLPHPPRPVVQIGEGARILIAGQAPGRRVHVSGVPFDDPSGERLRAWMGIDKETFYDRAKLAVVPMGFCFPGNAADGGDLPPRRECAPLWRARLLAHVPGVRLTLLIGGYAQSWHLATKSSAMTQTVRAFRDAPAGIVPLPHPSWRNTGWLKRNPWFEAELLPLLRAKVQEALA